MKKKLIGALEASVLLVSRAVCYIFGHDPVYKKDEKVCRYCRKLL